MRFPYCFARTVPLVFQVQERPNVTPNVAGNIVLTITPQQGDQFDPVHDAMVFTRPVAMDELDTQCMQPTT